MDDFKPTAPQPQERPLPGAPTPAPAAVLAPLELGAWLRETWRLYRENLSLLLVTAAVCLVPVGILSSIGVASRSNPAVASPLELMVMPLTLFLGLVVHGAVVKLIADLYLGRPTSARRAYSFVGQNLGRFALAQVITGLVVFAVVLLPAMGLGVLIGVGSATGGQTATAILLLAAMPVFLAVVLWISFAAAFVTETCLIEGFGGLDALRRSMKLVAGHRWRLFSYTVCLGFLVFAAILIPLGIAMTVFNSAPFAQQLVLTAANVVLYPLMWTGTVLFYYDIRVRDEAFGLEQLAQSVIAFGDDGFGS